MSVVSNNILAGASGQGGGAISGYDINRSLRFNSGDTATLSKSVSSAGNRKTWTFSFWVKLLGGGTYSTNHILCGGLSGGNASQQSGFEIEFTSTGALNVNNQVDNSIAWSVQSTALFRDYSAWYHVVVAHDTTQTTASNRVKIYVNGVQLNSFATANYPSQNYESEMNKATTNRLGASDDRGSPYLLSDFYLADVQFIDGQALDSSSFGATDSNGVWQPTAYSGSYGTNGFHLNFANNSTTAALGTDSSGNNNTFSVNNFSVAAGADNDSLFDSPYQVAGQTDNGAGGEIISNYATWNTLTEAQATYKQGNLVINTPSNHVFTTTQAVSSGKYYVEVEINSNAGKVGIWNFSLSGGLIGNEFGWTDGGAGYMWDKDGSVYNNQNITSYGNTYTTNDIIGVALDMDNGKVFFSKNGTFQNSGVPASGTNPAFSGLSGTFAIAVGSSGNGDCYTLNAGQRAYSSAAPSGYKSLCTANLLSTTVTSSGSYLGNSSTNGPFVFLNGVPTAMSIGGSAVTFGTGIDKLSNGFKITSSTGNNHPTGTTYSFSVTTTGDPFKTARAQIN